jgi:hypothetical protein
MPYGTVPAILRGVGRACAIQRNAAGAFIQKSALGKMRPFNIPTKILGPISPIRRDATRRMGLLDFIDVLGAILRTA